MSYILDALRKADAERERDPARGIHAQPAAVPLPAVRRAPRRSWLLAGVAAAAVVVALAWQHASAPAADVPPLVAPVPAPVTRLAAPAAPAVLIPVAASVEPPAPVVIIKTAPPERHALKAAAPAPAAAASAPAATAGTSAAPVAAAATNAAPAPAAASAPERIYAVSELPPDVQHQLPKLAISGGVSSESRAQRMLIVGGQVMFEGAELAPGVVLEQVRAKSAVLRFRGYRYSVGY